MRAKHLHSSSSGELFSRAMLSSLIAIPLFGCVLGILLCVDYLFDISVSFGSLPAVIYMPIAAWLVAGVLAVSRFLSYIDIRIRQEGWDVELQLRAEAIKLQQLGEVGV